MMFAWCLSDDTSYKEILNRLGNDLLVFCQGIRQIIPKSSPKHRSYDLLAFFPDDLSNHL